MTASDKLPGHPGIERTWDINLQNDDITHMIPNYFQLRLFAKLWNTYQL